MGDESTFQPFDRTGLLRRAAPFIGAMWLALVIYPLPPHGGDSDAFVTAVALNVIILVAVLIVPWRRLGPMAGVLPPLAYLLVIALLRQADGGGSSSYGALLMLPIFWLALYGSPQQLAVGFAGLAAVFVVPVFLIGAPDYPSERVDARAGVAVRRSDHRVHGAVARARAAQARRGEPAPRRRAPGQPGGDPQARRQHGRCHRGDP